MKNFLQHIIISFSTLLLIGCSGDDSASTSAPAPATNNEVTILGPDSIQFVVPDYDTSFAMIADGSNDVRFNVQVTADTCGMPGFGSGDDPDAPFVSPDNYLPFTAEYQSGGTGAFTPLPAPKVSGIYQTPDVTVPETDWNTTTFAGLYSTYGNDNTGTFLMIYVVPEEVRAGSVNGTVVRIKLNGTSITHGDKTCTIGTNNTQNITFAGVGSDPDNESQLKFANATSTTTFTAIASNPVPISFTVTGNTCGLLGFGSDDTPTNADNGGFSDYEYINIKTEYTREGETLTETTKLAGIYLPSATVDGNDWNQSSGEGSYNGGVFSMLYDVPSDVKSDAVAGTEIKFSFASNAVHVGAGQNVPEAGITCYFSTEPHTLTINS